MRVCYDISVGSMYFMSGKKRPDHKDRADKKASEENTYNFILDMMTPFNVFETVAVFVFAKRHFIKYSPSVTRWILDLSACSFGIYLVHPIILGKLRPFFDFDPNSYWPLLGIPLLTLIVFIVAYAIIKVMKLIPILGKYVM
mgnify:CR=1 FL=1